MDYYSILGVPKGADETTIRKAYKTLSMQHHPDRGGDEEKFKKINEAYSTLKDPQKRGMYDHQQNGGGHGFNFNTQNMGGFEDIFSHAFGGGFGGFQQQRQQRRNRDITIPCNITLEDVLKGKEVIATYRLRSHREESVNIIIPKGARHGDTIRYDQLGDDSIPNIPRGSLCVQIQLRRHPKFDRNNDDLWTTEKINALDLILGCSIIVNTLDGQQVRISIPQGTKPGTTFRVSDHGLPNIDTRRKGSLLVKIEALIPKITDETQLQQLRNIRSETGN